MDIQQRGKTLMIMRDVNAGWLVRYTHANVASFFLFLYMLILEEIYTTEVIKALEYYLIQ